MCVCVSGSRAVPCAAVGPFCARTGHQLTACVGQIAAVEKAEVDDRVHPLRAGCTASASASWRHRLCADCVCGQGHYKHYLHTSCSTCVFVVVQGLCKNCVACSKGSQANSTVSRHQDVLCDAVHTWQLYVSSYLQIVELWLQLFASTCHDLAWSATQLRSSQSDGRATTCRSHCACACVLSALAYVCVCCCGRVLLWRAACRSSCVLTAM